VTAPVADTVEGARTMPALLRARAAVDPKRTALRAKARGIWHTVTWGEVLADARAIAAGLGRCEAGTRIGILAPVTEAAWTAGIAVHLAGGSVVRLPEDCDAPILAELLALTAPGIVLVQDQEQLDRLVEAVEGHGAPRVDRIVLLDGRAESGGGPLPTLDDLRGTGVDAECAAARPTEDPAPEQEACVLFSGGVGGTVRAVGVSHAGLVEAARRVARVVVPGSGGDLLVQAGHADPTAQHLLVGGAAVASLVVDLPEHVGTVDADRREVAPAVLAMPARDWTRLHADLTDGVDLDRRPAKLAALRAKALLRHEGLGRVRVALSYGGRPAPTTTAFLARSGIRIADLYGTVDTGPVAVTARGSAEPALLVEERSLVLVDGELHVHKPSTGTTVRTGDLGVLAEARWTPGDTRSRADRTAAPLHEIETRIEESAFVHAAILERTGVELVAHVSLDVRGLGRWAASEGLDRRSYGTLAADPRVLALLTAELAAAEERDSVPAAARVARIRIHPRPFRRRTGELTDDGRVRPTAVGLPATEGAPVPAFEEATS
jgi:long-chain acyl-CoA synthetase